MKIEITLFLLLSCLLSGTAQMTQPVFPMDSGPVLLQKVEGSFKTNFVFDYSNARDTLYARVFFKDDSVRCIYTDHARHLPPFGDPSNAIFLNGAPLGLNCEHSYPQSKGAEEFTQGHSDMHHLFPSRVDVNETRGSFPYADIPDNTVQEWFWKNFTQTGIPNANRDNWSEARQGSFEPREAVKGDLARAIFYFYTMYHNQADLADPAFFPAQRSVLCDWHFADPVDSFEWERTWRIARYQDNKPNPFILDCSLAARSYCIDRVGDCPNLPIVSTKNDQNLEMSVLIYPNPSTDQFFVRCGDGKPLQWELMDTFGRRLSEGAFRAASEGHNWRISTEDLPKGAYFLYLKTENSVFLGKIIKN